MATNDPNPVTDEHVVATREHRTATHEHRVGRRLAVIVATALTPVAITAAATTGSGAAATPPATSATHVGAKPESPAAAGVASPTGAPPVVGGKPADINRSPWAVYLADQQDREFCGGAIAGATKIVTAAHCVAGEATDAVRAVSGRQDTGAQAGTVAGVTDIWVHPGFEGPYRGQDVAVLTLDRELPQPPLALATGADDAAYAPGNRATIYGWGSTGENNHASTTLREADIGILDDRECSDAYGERYRPGAMVCAGRTEGGVDACQGDSGGPLVTGGRLIGLVSFGDGCARPGKPGVYTRVAAHQPELREQLSIKDI